MMFQGLTLRAKFSLHSGQKLECLFLRGCYAEGPKAGNFRLKDRSLIYDNGGAKFFEKLPLKRSKILSHSIFYTLKYHSAPHNFLKNPQAKNAIHFLCVQIPFILQNK